VAFTSLSFAGFVAVAFFAYWLVFGRSSRSQNLLLIAASCLFYASWDWRFLALIACNVATDYVVGRRLGITTDARSRRRLLAVSLAVNLGLLGLFKYFHFFVSGLAAALGGTGLRLHPPFTLLLPVAISFYTLQTMSYSIDVYYRRIEPTRDLAAFAAYILFFPKLLAGPIERAGRCLPQFLERRRFDPASAREGMRQVLWGLAKKVIVADACGRSVDAVFAGSTARPAGTLLLGALLYAFEIYADFSGYSDIAIGTARLFGVGLTRNFAYPYFARSVAEFWRRWHISLSTWLRDYVFLPLSFALSRRLDRERYLGLRTDRAISLVATLVTFLLCGVWHGANWTFVVWGLLFGLYLIPQAVRLRGFGSARVTAGTPAARDLGRIALTFLLVTVAWVFFRAPTLHDAFAYLRAAVSPPLLPAAPPAGLAALPPVAVLVAVEWLQRERDYGLDLRGRALARSTRWALYLALCAGILLTSEGPRPFVYFRF